MSLKNWQILTAVVGGLLFLSIIFLIVFGVKLGGAQKDKTNEVKTKLSEQQKKLEEECQAFKEINTTTYIADDVFGSFQFDYPKVWSTTVTKSVKADANQSMTFLGDPNLIVLSDKDFDKAYSALRVQVISKKYPDYLAATEKQLTGKSAKFPFEESDATISDIKGKSFVGHTKDRTTNIRFILVQIRDKTLYVGTDDNEKFSSNLDTIVNSFKIIK